MPILAASSRSPGRGSSVRQPLILYEPAGRGTLVVRACCPQALRGGIREGMPLAEAESLLPRTTASFLQHDPRVDREALQALAHECVRYTPMVALEETDAPECLLLDIAGSAHLFGGERKLAPTVLRDFRSRGYHASLGIADGIGAAWASAHALAEPGIKIIPPGKNDDVVPSLRLEVLRLEPKALALLREFDIRTVRQLMDLPRGQVVARFGKGVLDRLDQALGQASEILTPELSVEPIADSWPFEDPVSEPRILEAVIQRLVRQLFERAASERLGVRRLFARFKTVDRQWHSFSVGLLQPSSSADHVLHLVRLKMEAARLPAAVVEIAVRVMTAPVELHQQRWLQAGDEQRQRAVLDAFLERLGSKLGEKAVLQPRLCADPQPEFAGQCVSWLRPAAETLIPPCQSEAPGALTYPVDLLAVPLAVRVQTRDDVPCRFTLDLRAHQVAHAWGPHRIEAGWWRGCDIHRDYFRVESHTGERFWLFRDERQAWFLHGVFA